MTGRSSNVAAALDAATAWARPAGARGGRRRAQAWPRRRPVPARGPDRRPRCCSCRSARPKASARLDLEEAGGSLAQKLRGAQAARGSAGLIRRARASACRRAEVAAALALGAALRAYRFTKYRTGDGKDEDERGPERLRVARRRRADAPIAATRSLAAAVCRARDLVSEPGNVLTPKAFADACAGLAEAGLEVEILDRAELTRLGMNALAGGGPRQRRAALCRGHALAWRRRRAAAGAGRQGRLLRHRRHLDQAGAGHGGHEVRHGRCGRRVRHHAGPGRPQGARPMSWAWSGWSRTCRRPTRSGRATWSRQHVRQDHRGRSTPTPRAASCWPTCSTTRASGSSPRR